MNENNHQCSEGSSLFRTIDHIAIAVRDLEPAVKFFTGVLGFSLIRRLEVRGQRTGMLSAELQHGDIKFVLCQGTEPDSQVSKLVSNYGPGVAHIALSVDQAQAAADHLGQRGLSFDTSVIQGPGLRQVFTTRDPNSGLSFELIERTSEEGFIEDNVRSLFEQLEKSDSY